MYTLSTTPAVVRLSGSLEWTTVDLSQAICSEIMSNYRVAEVGITDTFGAEFTLDLFKYEPELRLYNRTLTQWLHSIGSRALTVVNGLPTLNLVNTNYMPHVWDKNCTVKLAHPGWHPSQTAAAVDLTDMVITHPTMTPEYLHNYTLCNVYGYWLLDTYHDYGQRIYDAGAVLRRTKNTGSGWLNFETIGKIKKIPITADMVFKADETKSWNDRILIKTDTPLFNKTVGIVLGGYLHLCDGLVKTISDNTITLTLGSLPIVERIICSKEDLDLSELGFDELDVGLSAALLMSDDVAYKYLLSKYSFLVVIDNPYCCTKTFPVDDKTSFGTFLVDGSAPVLGVLEAQYGRHLDYWPKYEFGKWVLYCTAPLTDLFAFSTTTWESLHRFNSAKAPDYQASAQYQMRYWSAIPV